MQERLPKESPNIAQNFEANVEKSSVMEQKEGMPKEKDQRVNKSHNRGEKLDPDCMLVTSSICVEKYNARFTLSKTDSSLNSQGEYIDLQCNSQEDLM